MRGMALSLMILVTPFHGCGVETLIFGADDVLSTDMRYFTSGLTATPELLVIRGWAEALRNFWMLWDPLTQFSRRGQKP
jgi:hypothetical protein